MQTDLNVPKTSEPCLLTADLRRDRAESFVRDVLDLWHQSSSEETIQSVTDKVHAVMEKAVGR